MKNNIKYTDEQLLELYRLTYSFVGKNKYLQELLFNNGKDYEYYKDEFTSNALLWLIEYDCYNKYKKEKNSTFANYIYKILHYNVNIIYYQSIYGVSKSIARLLSEKREGNKKYFYQRLYEGRISVEELENDSIESKQEKHLAGYLESNARPLWKDVPENRIKEYNEREIYDEFNRMLDNYIERKYSTLLCDKKNIDRDRNIIIEYIFNDKRPTLRELGEKYNLTYQGIACIIENFKKFCKKDKRFYFYLKGA